MDELLCPKCQAPMRSYERSGVVVDRCTECRGLFLDRGELERLIDAESVRPQPALAGDHDAHVRTEHHDDDDEPRADRFRDRLPFGRGHEPEDGTRRRRRGGLLGDLLDMGGGD